MDRPDGTVIRRWALPVPAPIVSNFPPPAGSTAVQTDELTLGLLKSSEVSGTAAPPTTIVTGAEVVASPALSVALAVRI